MRCAFFLSAFRAKDIYNGTVGSLHDIWSMHVYVNQLEFKGDQLRGFFEYKIQDHFGLDVRDIDHHPFDEIEENDGKPYERLDGFRSWYILQHYKNYAFKPFTTKLDFELR